MMKTPAQIEQEIIDYYYDNFSPLKFVFWGPKVPVTLDARLREDLKIGWDDGDDAINTYLSIWHVDPAGMESPTILPQSFSVQRCPNNA